MTLKEIASDIQASLGDGDRDYDVLGRIAGGDFSAVKELGEDNKKLMSMCVAICGADNLEDWDGLS